MAYISPGILGGYRYDSRFLRSQSCADRHAAGLIIFLIASPQFTPGLAFFRPVKVNAATIRRAIVGEGCIISDAHIERAVIGIRSIIETGATIRNSVIMGADFYEDEANEVFEDAVPRPPIGIGRNSVIDRAIIDKNARIGESVVITPTGKHPTWIVRTTTSETVCRDPKERGDPQWNLDLRSS